MMLDALAAQPSSSRGRAHPEVDAGPRGPRDIFQRDRDRIIHSVSFRRLRHKTQVFVAPDGDHYRVRLTHSIEVRVDASQAGRNALESMLLDRATALPSLPIVLDRIKEMHPHFNGDYVVVLEDGRQLRLSRTRREQLEARLRINRG